MNQRTSAYQNGAAPIQLQLVSASSKCGPNVPELPEKGKARNSDFYMKTPDFEMFAYSSSFSQKKKKTCADQIKHFYQAL